MKVLKVILKVAFVAWVLNALVHAVIFMMAEQADINVIGYVMIAVLIPMVYVVGRIVKRIAN